MCPEALEELKRGSPAVQRELSPSIRHQRSYRRGDPTSRTPGSQEAEGLGPGTQKEQAAVMHTMPPTHAVPSCGPSWLLKLHAASRRSWADLWDRDLLRVAENIEKYL